MQKKRKQSRRADVCCTWTRILWLLCFIITQLLVATVIYEYEYLVSMALGATRITRSAARVDARSSPPAALPAAAAAAAAAAVAGPAPTVNLDLTREHLLEQKERLLKLQNSLIHEQPPHHQQNHSISEQLERVKQLFGINRIYLYEMMDSQNKSLVPNVFLVCFPPPDFICIDEVLYKGHYEGWLMQWQLWPELQKHSRDDLLFVDGGANLGLYTTFVASKGYRTLSFEANPDTFKLLQANVYVNGLRSVVQLENKGLGETAEVLQIPSWDRNYGASSFKAGWGKDVQVVRLGDDRRLIDHCRQGKPVYFKLDVEGFEMKVFRGAEWLFATQCVKAFQVEQLEYYHKKEEIDLFIALLEAYGYKITNRSSDQHYVVERAPNQTRVDQVIGQLRNVHPEWRPRADNGPIFNPLKV